jgi:hypothetical protein
MSIAYAIDLPAQRQPEPVENPCVLRGRPLRPGATLTDTARFGDDVWDLAPALLKAHCHKLSMYFTTVPERFRPAAKTLFDAMLSGAVPDGEDTPEVSHVHGVFMGMRPFLAWLDGHWPQGRAHLSELTGNDLEAYLRHLLTEFPDKPRRRTGMRTYVRFLWRWRHCLGEDALKFDPALIDGWNEKNGKRGENVTPRIPEPVLGALMTWAMRFIDEFSGDILRAEALRREYRRPLEQDGRLGRGEGAERIRAGLGRYLAEGRPLPGRDGKLNQRYLAQLLRTNVIHINSPTQGKCHEEIAAAIAQVGLSETSRYEMQVAARLGESTWVPWIEVGHRDPYSLARLARLLQAAVYMITAFLSGIRDSEIKHLKRGCVHIQHDSEGNAYRWKVASLAFKGEQDETHGVPAVWTVGEPVARALAVLEALQPPETQYLFGRLPHGPGHAKGTGEALTTGSTIKQLNKFTAWINDYCRRHERPDDSVPLVDGREFKLRTGHYRRTLAWYIARRPGGVIAGALAYRHHSIQMFEGYAGTSDSGFRAEVEAEQAMARGEVYMEMIEAHEHLDLAGPCAAEAATRLKDFGERAQYQGKIALDKNRLLRIMKRNDPAIYPGEYITCIHNPVTALCEKAKHARAEGLPEHGGCQPLACRNVALTAENIQAWMRELGRISQRLATRPPLPPLLATRLAARHAEITEFLARNDLAPVTT